MKTAGIGFAPVRRRRYRALLVLAIGLAGAPAWAVEASVYLLTPTVTQGDREIDSHSGVSSSGPAVARESDSTLALGMGLTEHWFSELGLRYARVGAAGTSWDVLEWENVLALAEPGEWPIDVGVALEAEVPHQSAQGVSVRAGPLLQKDFYNIEVNCNVLFGHYLRTGEFTATQIEYQAQIKIRYRQPLEFGLQAFGNFASPTRAWAGYAEQLHRVGPAIMGRFLLPQERSISYNAAYLVGTTAHSPDRTLRVQVEYEF
jgi:hypothetical protein